MQTKISKLNLDENFLLGFSGGVDSSALFFMLLEAGVKFDLAIIDYGMRNQSKEEVSYAKELGRKYQKQVHLLNAPQITHNFEAKARNIRYEFFASLLESYHYDGVILAHQLNDRLEWLLMQLCKGAGLNTLLGFDEIENRGKMKIYRPLLEVSKQELYQYCALNKIKFFEDESNQDTSHLRNFYRQLIQSLGEKELGGVRTSLRLLNTDKQRLYPNLTIHHLGSIIYFHHSCKENSLHLLDQELKKQGYLLSRAQREEILRCQFNCEIHHWAIEKNEKFIFLCQKVTIKIPKTFRDFARKARIPKRLRAPLYQCLEDKSLTLNEIEVFFNTRCFG